MDDGISGNGRNKKEKFHLSFKVLQLPRAGLGDSTENSVFCEPWQCQWVVLGDFLLCLSSLVASQAKHNWKVKLFDCQCQCELCTCLAAVSL